MLYNFCFTIVCGTCHGGRNVCLFFFFKYVAPCIIITKYYIRNNNRFHYDRVLINDHHSVFSITHEFRQLKLPLYYQGCTVQCTNRFLNILVPSIVINNLMTAMQPFLRGPCCSLTLVSPILP